MGQDWHPERIKAEVRMRGTTLSAIALKLGVSRALISISLQQPNSRAERAIAKVIGVHPSVIWPSRYHADGRRRSPQPKLDKPYQGFGANAA